MIASTSGSSYQYAALIIAQAGRCVVLWGQGRTLGWVLAQVAQMLRLLRLLRLLRCSVCSWWLQVPMGKRSSQHHAFVLVRVGR